MKRINFEMIKEQMKNNLVFMGGTCNDSLWREELIEYANIKSYKINWFNPVVDDWNEEAVKKEYEVKSKADYQLYVITPKMKGVFSIAEVVDSSNKQPSKTIFCILDNYENGKFKDFEKKSLEEVKNLVEKNGSMYFSKLTDIADYLK